MRISRFVRCLALLALATIAMPAGAICPPLQRVKYVGPTSDNQCNYATLQAAVEDATCPETIYVTREQGYANQVITIQDKSLNIVGTAQCGGVLGRADSVALAARTDLVGDGVHAVFNISGNSHVVLSNLSISGGNGDTGGGIGYSGAGSLKLEGVEITANRAQLGGGVAVEAFGANHIDFSIVDNAALVTDIHDNSSTSNGGGIYIYGDVHLVAASKTPGGMLVRQNRSMGLGGGLYLGDFSVADIAMPGESILANSAAQGGGIAQSGNASVLRLFSTDPVSPTEVVVNVATADGGGVYVASGSASAQATTCLFDTTIKSNKSRFTGTAIFVGSYGHLAINAQDDPKCDFSAVSALGAQRCLASTMDCNRMRDNRGDYSGSLTAASVFEVSDHASLSMRRARAYTNIGGSVIHAAAATGAAVSLVDTLVDHNGTSDIIELAGATLDIDSCTFANNFSGSGFQSDSAVTLRRSIVQESTGILAAIPPANLTLHYMLINPPVFAADSTVQFGDAQFVDGVHGDQHLTALSPALDFAPADGIASAQDLDGQWREVDLPGRTNLFGARDLGAYEREPDGVTDRLFIGSFE